MKLKKIITAVVLATIAAPSFAQYENTSVSDRVGHGQDSVQALCDVMDFQDAIKAQDWKAAYTPWRKLMQEAPFSLTSLYKSSPYMLYSLIAAEQDPAQKKVYFDELMGVYDKRLENLDALNSFDKIPASKGDVMAYKAYYYDITGNGLDTAYNSNKLYDMYKKGIDEVAMTGGHEVDAAVLYRFFTVSMALYQAYPDYYREQFLKDYIDTREACQNMMQRATDVQDTAEQVRIVKEYDNTLQNVEYYFTQSGAANDSVLIAYFGPKIEENQDNVEWLNGALKVLASNGCSDAECYFNAAEYAYAIMPTYESAIGCALKYMALGEIDKSAKFYDEAIELCPIQSQKGDICLYIARTLTEKGEYDKAETYLVKAEELVPTLAGKCSYQRGEINIGKQKWDDAIANFKEAEEKDVTLVASSTRKIEAVEKYKTDIAAAQAAAQKAARERAKRQAAAAAAARAARNGGGNLTPAQQAAKAEYQRKLAEYNRKKAEYDRQKAAYEARKKADDDFWNK